jgi:hypothetical protein
MDIIQNVNLGAFFAAQAGNAAKNRAIRSNSSAPTPDACGIFANNRASGYSYPIARFRIQDNFLRGGIPRFH